MIRIFQKTASAPALLKLKKFTLVCATITLASCGAAKLAEPGAEDVKRGAQKYPGYTLEMMKQDKAMFEQKCNTCHSLKKPSSQLSEKWPSIVGGMTRRSLKKPEKTIKPEEANAITRYLVTMGKQK